jgi:hypothetical protein
MGLLWFAVTLRRAGQGLGWAVPAYLALAFVCLVLAEIDAATGLLPNTITYPAFPVMAGLLLVISLGLDELGRLGRGLLAAASVGGLFLLLALLSPTAWGLLARLSHGTRVVLFELSERVNCGLFRVGRWVDGPWPGSSSTVVRSPGPRSTRSLASPRGSLPTRRRRIAPSRPRRMLPGRTSAIWKGRWWSCLSRSPASTTTGVVGGGTCGIGISSPSIEPQAELT